MSITWENILSLTTNLVQRDFHVVIDFVVEEELEWFCSHFSDLPVSIKYAVLVANEETLAARLTTRGDPYLLDRSLFLLRKLQGLGTNSRYLCDTTSKEPAAVVEEIISLPHFRMSS